MEQTIVCVYVGVELNFLFQKSAGLDVVDQQVCMTEGNSVREYILFFIFVVVL